MAYFYTQPNSKPEIWKFILVIFISSYLNFTSNYTRIISEIFWEKSELKPKQKKYEAQKGTLRQVFTLILL